MTEPVVAAYTIGQTPRPDLAEELSARLPSVEFTMVGALDGLERDEIHPCSPHGYPLETRLEDGSRIIVDAHFVNPLLQEAINARDAAVDAHLVLCAGSFPRLAAPAPPLGSPVPRTPCIRPFDVAVDVLGKLRYRRIEVVVPFGDQANPAMDKWGGKDFACRAHVFAEKPRHRSPTEWLTGLMRGSRAQALVFDYVGLPGDVIDEAIAKLDMPVFDLGRLAMDALEAKLQT